MSEVMVTTSIDMTGVPLDRVTVVRGAGTRVMVSFRDEHGVTEASLHFDDASALAVFCGRLLGEVSGLLNEAAR